MMMGGVVKELKGNFLHGGLVAGAFQGDVRHCLVHLLVGGRSQEIELGVKAGFPLASAWFEVVSVTSGKPRVAPRVLASNPLQPTMLAQDEMGVEPPGLCCIVNRGERVEDAAVRPVMT